MQREIRGDQGGGKRELESTWSLSLSLSNSFKPSFQSSKSKWVKLGEICDLQVKTTQAESINEPLVIILSPR